MTVGLPGTVARAAPSKHSRSAAQRATCEVLMMVNDGWQCFEAPEVSTSWQKEEKLDPNSKCGAAADGKTCF